MSGMLASRVCFRNILPMFVLLASLFLAKCISGVTLLETAPSPPNVINNTDGNLEKNNSEILSGRNNSVHLIKDDSDEHSKNASILEKETSIIAPLNETSRVSTNMSTIDASSIKLMTETDATKGTAAMPTKSTTPTPAKSTTPTPAKSTTSTPAKSTTPTLAKSTSPKVSTNSSDEERSGGEKQPEANATTVTPVSSEKNASTTVSNVANTLPQTASEANPTTLENVTMAAGYVETTTTGTGDSNAATATGLLLASWLVGRAVW